MKKILTMFSLILTAFAFSASAKAVSNDECAIWLCLPSGFSPADCSGPKSAMKKRVFHGKSPVPSFSSCAVSHVDGSNNEMNSNSGRAAYIPPTTKCVKYAGTEFDNCVEYEYVPEQIIHGTGCLSMSEGRRKPEGCTRTLYWAEIFINGNKQGNRYYFD